MSNYTNNLAAYCWSIADLLRGDFKQSQYGRIILPFTLLRRLECVLEDSKAAVLAENEKVKKMNLPEEAQEKLLLRATNGLSFFNTSKMDLSKLGESGIKDNVESYIQGFSALKAKQLQTEIGSKQHDDMNGFDDAIKAACKKHKITLDTKEKKLITSAVSWKNPDAEKVIRRSSASMSPLHTGHPDHKKIDLSFYGVYKVDGMYVEYKADGDLRDNENVALDPSKPVNEINETYFKKEVQPHVPDAWIDANKKDAKDGEIGIVGYEIPFNRHFYQYQPPRDLVEIDADLDKVSAEIMALLQEVHS